jgi:VCBS repeat-containing protein
MLPFFESLLTNVKNRLARKSSTRKPVALVDRRLKMESLESRRVLATVTGFTPTSSGFNVQLSEEISTVNLNLYDTQSQAAGAADVTLRGASVGDVTGSLIVSGTTLRFVSTGGPLAPDTYTVTLRSADNGITDLADGGLLDGEFSGTFPSGNSSPGGNFVTTFTVGSAQQLVVGLPDFARGPTQPVNVPATGSGTALPTGLPIQFSNAVGITSFTMTLNYNPAMLNISAVQLGADAPTGSRVEPNLTTPGTVTIAFFSLAPLAAGQADLVNLVATIPEDAPYGSADALRISAIEINSGAITATADDAVQIVAFPGDANANRRYDAEDARLIARVGVGLDTGFVINQPTGPAASTTDRLFPRFDPEIIADVTGVDGLSPLDASDVLRRVVGLATPNIPALPAAQTPLGISLSRLTVAENATVGTTVGTFTTNDPDAGDTHTYSLVSGTGSTDNASFTISGNSLRTATTFNRATKDTYNIRVQTTDSTGRTFQQTFVITVTLPNAAPTAIAISSATVAENAAVGTSIGTLTSTDSDAGNTHTYSIVSVDGNTNAAPFSISGNSLRVANALDFETKASYVVRIRTTDQGGLTFEQNLTITVTNVNEAPTAIALSSTSIPNNSASGTVVGNLSTTDPDTGNTHTYTLVTGTGSTDNASFSIQNNQLRAATTISFGTKTSYSVRVRSTDAAGLSTEQTFTITQSNGNVAPTGVTLSANTVAENAAAATVIGTLSSTDANASDTHTYSLVSGTGDTNNSSFTISGNQLRTSAALNFETTPTLSIRVRSTDAGGLTFDQVLTINVTNVNEGATDITLSSSSVANGQPSGTIVGLLGNNDPDASNTFTYSLVTGTGSTDNASFTINSSNQLVTAFAANQATKSSYSVRVRVVDAGGLSTEKAFTISVTGTNVAPTAIALSATSIADGSASGTNVGTFSSTDANTTDTHTYSLVTGAGSTDNASFTIVNNQLRTATAINAATKSSYSIRVRTTDSFGLTFEQSFTITVSAGNQAPTAIALSTATVAENAAVATVVGTLSTTDPNSSDVHSYSLVSGTGDSGNSSFSIVGNQLRTAAALNFETTPTLTVRVRSTDAGALSFDQVLTITVTNVNEAATDIILSSSSVANGQPSGTIVGLLSNNDPDAGNTFTYSLVSGTGSTDNGSFTINSSNQLVTAFVANQATKSSYSVRVRVVDAAGLSTEKAFTISITGTNVAPTAIALSSTSVTESAPVGTTVGTFSSTDANSTDTHTYSLVTGTGSTDNASFTIVSGQLRTATTFDVDTKSSYSIRVRTTDAGGLTFEQPFTIAITNANLAPTAIALSANSVAENAASGTVVGTLASTDPNSTDTHTYTLVTGTGDTNNGSFTIVGNELRTSASFNFETQPTLSIRVRSTDSGSLTFEQVLTINVTNVNEAATDITLSATAIADAAPSGTIVGTLGSNDPDAGNTITYTLVTGTGSTDNASFTINSSGQLVTAFVANQATKASYSVRVRATDAGSLSTEEAFTITVTTGNIAPSAIALSANSVAENAASGTVIGTLSSTDANSGDTHTYTLVTGTGSTDNGSFTIVGNELRTNASFNFETQPTLSVRVRSTDSGSLTFEQVLTINVTNVNEAATDITLSATTIADAAPSGTIVGTLGSNDPDAGNTITYTLVTGTGSTDNASFTINSSGQLVTGFVANQATKASYSVRVRATDAGSLSTEEAFTITVTTGNIAPSAIALSANSVAENAASGTVIGTLSSTDANSGDTHTYTLVTGTGSTDNGSFTIVGNELRTNASFNFETQPTLSARVRSTDSGSLTFEQVLTINVTNVNEAATDITLSATTIADAAPSGTIVGTLGSNDPDAGNTITYTLVTGTGSTDNASFTINSSGQLVTAFVANQATKASYSVRVRATDAGSLSTEEAFTITVTTGNIAPSAIALSANSVAENAASGTVIGTLSSTDSNSGDTHTYTLVTGTGSTDNGSFTIVGNELRTNASFNFETQPTLSVRVRSTDSGSLTFEQVLTINVTNVNEAATDITLSATAIADAAPSGTIVGTLGSNDPDAGNTITYTLVTGTGSTDNASFTINSSGQLVTGFVANQATKASYSVRVRATDAGSLSTEEAFTITVTPGNVAPTAIALSANSVAENAASGTVVGTLSSTDSNSGDTHTYTLVTGTGSTDNGSFTIVGNELRTNASFNFETQPTLSVRVRSTDSGSLTFEQVLTINVTNVNEAATDITLSATTIADAAPIGTIVGTLGSNDPDAGNTITYTLVTGTGSTDNASFTINSSGQLVTGFVANQATKASYSVRVRATDAGSLSTEEAFTITVTPGNVAPTAIALSANSVAENAASGTVIGTLSSTDANSGDTHTYTLVTGTGSTDNGSFTIVGNELRTNASFNFETQPTLSVRVRSTDSGSLTFEQVLTINVTNVNEAATDITLSATAIADAAPSGTIVGTLGSNDPDAGNTITYTLVTGTGDTDNASFTINSSGELVTGFVANQATKASYSVRVRATDAGSLSTEEAFTITVTPGNVAPTAIALSANSVAENAASGTVIGTLSSTDANSGDTHTYTLVTGTGSTDNGSFTIVGNELRTNASFNFETQPTLSVRVRSTDSGSLTFEQVLTINVTNVNEAATDITLSATAIADAAPSGTIVGTLGSNDPDAGNTITYTLVTGTGDTDNASFTINSSGELVTGFVANQATKASYSVRVRATDAGSLSTEEAFTITVTTNNTAPTALALSALSIAEDAASGATVGNFTTTDANAGDTFTYSLVSGTGDTDNGSFTVTNNQLLTNTTFDFDTKSSYSVRVRTTDAGGLTFEQPFTITITAVPQAPTAIALSTNSVAESATVGTVVGTLSSTDSNGSDTHAYTLVSGTGDTDNASFTVVGNEVRTAVALNFESKPTYTVRVRSTDTGSLFFEQSFTINVTNVNEAATDITLSSTEIADGAASGTIVGTFSSDDPDAADTLTYTLATGTGDTDNASFTINWQRRTGYWLRSQHGDQIKLFRSCSSRRMGVVCRARSPLPLPSLKSI